MLGLEKRRIDPVAKPANDQQSVFSKNIKRCGK